MMKGPKKLLSGTLLLLFAAFLLVCSSHFHAKNQGPEKENCPVCQVSQNFQKQGLVASSLKIYHFQSSEEIIPVSQEFSTSRFLFFRPSRAPPASI